MDPAGLHDFVTWREELRSVEGLGLVLSSPASLPYPRLPVPMH